MLELGDRSRPYRSLRCRALALGLLAIVVWSSVEVLWEGVHVVVPGPQEPAPERTSVAFEGVSVSLAQQDQPAAPPYRCPRITA